MARAIASMIRMLAWWGTKHVEVVDGDAGAVERLLADLGHRERRPAEDRVALHRQVRHAPGASEATTSRQSSVCRIRSNCSPSEPHTTGPMPGVSLGPTTAAPAPSAKMNAVPRSLEVGEVGEPLDADHQRRSRRCRRGRSRTAIATPWQKPAQAAEMSNAAAWSVPSSWAIAVAMAGVWSMWLTVATMTQSICRGVDAGALERLAGGGDRHQLHGLLGRGPAALLDAGALLDPLVAGVDRLDDLGVGDHPRRAGRRRCRGSRRAAAPWCGLRSAAIRRLPRGAGGAAAGRARPGRRPRPATRRPGRRGRR